MIDLIIKKKSDGSVYWKASFNSKAEMEAWISIDEKTRPVIEQGYEYEIIDKTLEVKNQAKLIEEQMKAERKAKSEIKKKIKALSQKGDLSNAEIKQAILEIADLVDL
jgi:uncharacterized coiled-coil DUF342 family protein